MNYPTENTAKHKLGYATAMQIVKKNETMYEREDLYRLTEEQLYDFLAWCGFEWTGDEWKYWGTA